MHADLGLSERSQQADFGRTQQRSSRQGHLPCPQILACATQILSPALAGRYRHALTLALHHFLHDDAIGTRGYHGAGHDAHGLPGCQAALKGVPCQGLADHLQRRRAVRQQIGMPQGIAIHGRIVVRWHIQTGQHRLIEHPTQSLTRKQAFMTRNRRQQREDQRARLINRQSLRVMTIDTGKLFKQRSHRGFRHPEIEPAFDTPGATARALAAASSARVLMLSKAAASAKSTGKARTSASQVSNLRPPRAR